MTQAFLYILYSNTLDRYYIGSTRDVQGRLRRHLTSHSGFTSKARDWKTMAAIPFDSPEEAHRAEVSLKRQKDRKSIERLINTSK